MDKSALAGRYKALQRNYRKRQPKYTYDKMTVGTVVDSNDPQQMGRLRVWCSDLGDTATTLIGEIPWSSYVSPLGGTDRLSTRGRENKPENLSVGPVGYGMWNIPNCGATVLIACIDGDTRFRVWLGCLHGQYLTHTMPHGRHIDNGGPVTSEEQPIYPLYVEQAIAFNNEFDSPEYATRGSDRQVSSLDGEIISSNDQNVATTKDDIDVGYAKSRFNPDAEYASTDCNRESQIYSWTTPGFHAFSMDDSVDTCHIRLRTTHGSQIILDDTNERIYISTAKGASWIEMDESGNIDMYSEKRISMHSKQDINIQSDAAVRINGKAGVHINSGTETRITSATDTHISVGSTLHLNSDSAFNISADSIAVVSSTTLELTANTSLQLTGLALASLYSPGPLSLVGTPLNVNSTPPPPPGTIPTPADTFDAWLSMRVPEHEPWPRVVMTDAADGDAGNSQVLQLSSTDANVGKLERDETIPRNDNWRR